MLLLTGLNRLNIVINILLFLLNANFIKNADLLILKYFEPIL